MSEWFLKKFPDALSGSYAVPPLVTAAARYRQDQSHADGVGVLVYQDTGAAPDPAPAQAFTARPPSLQAGARCWDTGRTLQQKPVIATNVHGASAERLVRQNLQHLAQAAGPHFLFSGIFFGKVSKDLKQVYHKYLSTGILFLRLYVPFSAGLNFHKWDQMNEEINNISLYII